VRIIIECPENILHLEAGYIYADCRSSTLNLLQSGGGPYIYANNAQKSQRAVQGYNGAH
jgi:hypothetical protein